MSRTVEWILRIGLSFTFFYPPVAAYLDPFSWICFFPQFLRYFVGNDTLLLHAFGVFELAIGIWILAGKRILVPSLLAAAILAGIIVFDWRSMDIVFRDVSILAMALALAVKHHKERRL